MRLVIAEIRLPEALLRIERLAKDPDPMLQAIAMYVKATMQEAFTNQGRPAGSWRPRAVPNIAGIIRDFHDGLSEPLITRFVARPALIDSKRLSQNLDAEVVGNAVVAGSNLDYAWQHQFGNEDAETEEVTEEFQAWLADFILGEEQKIRREYGTDAADVVRESMDKNLGWLTSARYTGKKIPVRIPARPFLEVLPEDEANIQEIALDFLTGKAVADG